MRQQHLQADVFKDNYRIVLWPAPPSDVRVLKQ
jgi:hypothetical protein